MKKTVSPAALNYKGMVPNSRYWDWFEIERYSTQSGYYSKPQKAFFFLTVDLLSYENRGIL